MPTPARDVSSGNGDEIDRDDALVDREDVPFDKLMEMLKSDGDDGSDVAFGSGTGSEPAGADTVAAEEGADLVHDARSKGRSAAKVAAAPPADAPKDDAPAEGTAVKADDAPVEPKLDTPAAQAAPVAPAATDDDTLLAGLPDDSRAAVKARLTAADEVLAVFKGREVEMERHGTKPADAIKRLVDINAYAATKPAEYLAWAASQIGDPAALLTKAAETLGLKLVATTADADEADPFESDDIKAMRRELAGLRAAQQAPQLGPDAPAQRAATELAQFAAQAEHWQTTSPMVASLAKAHNETTGKAVTLDDVKRFHTAAVVAMGLQPAATPVASAAQPVVAVAQPAATTQAAPADSVQRAKAASKSLDGSGQGAGRRPALDPDASLKDVLTSLMQRQTES